MVNLSAFIRFHATRTPDQLALIYEDQRITYADLWARIQALAAWMDGQGIGAGDVVAVFMKNSSSFIEIAFATSYLGGVFLPVNFRLAADEVAYITGNAEAKLVFADAEFQPVVRDLPKTVLLDAAAQKDIRALTGIPSVIPPQRPRQPGDLFRLMYTSGTTDRPKGVMHSYDNYYWKNMEQAIFLGLTRDDRILTVGPLYHVGAFDLPGTAVLWVGGTMCILRDFDPAWMLAAIERERLTCAWMAPVMLGRALTLEGRQKYDLTSLRWTIGGGEKTPESRIRAFTELFPNGRYIDGYGLTETCSGDTLMEAGMEIAKIGSTGRPTPHCEIRITDDDGKEVPAGQQGEICVRGPKVTKGYWKDPEKTEASFYPEGWFRSGDVGYVDTDGFLYITDRKKDMILSGGENIASSEVERVIYQMPQVSEVAVIGVPDEHWGEKPVAVIVPKPGQTLAYEVMRDHCRQHLASFKVPKELHLREALPRNPSGKILKRVLRDEFMPDQADRQQAE